jgi:hypothetical protein
MTKHGKNINKVEPQHPGFCPGLLEGLNHGQFFNQIQEIMPVCLTCISWSDSKLFRLSGGFFCWVVVGADHTEHHGFLLLQIWPCTPF